MEDFIFTILRSGFSFLILLAISFWIGKQLNSHINHYNFALTITIGSFIANMGFNTNQKYFPMLAGLFILILIYFFFSIISFKSRPLRKLFSGQPTVIIEDGKILDENMKKIKYTLDDLNQQLREVSIFDIQEIQYAIVEVSGKLSVMKKTKYQTVTKEDINPLIKEKIKNIPIELIMNGEKIHKNFNSAHSESWLENQLSLRKLEVTDIQYAVVSSDGFLFIDLFNDKIKDPSDLH